MSDAPRVDLLARRAARLEANGTPHVFIVGAMEYEGPPELPLTFVDLLREARFTDALRTLFGDRTTEFVRLAEPTMGDLMEIAREYGASLPSSMTSDDD